MNRDTDIGAALRRFRMAARLNQAEVARALGVSQSQVSRWESGRDRPRPCNMGVIEALIEARTEPIIAGLVQYVRGAGSPLVLFDARLAIVAASPFLRMRGGPLASFGWLFDPGINPALGAMAKRFETLARTEPVVALEIPFSHEARPWACTGRLTVNRIGPDLYAIGEISFVRDEKQTIRAIALRSPRFDNLKTGAPRL